MYAVYYTSVITQCCCSVIRLCLTLCGPLDCKHTRLPCPSTSPGICPSLCHWICDAFQPSHPVLLLPSIFPRISVFPVNQPFTLGGQRTEASASASVLPLGIQGWFLLRLDWFDLLAVQGTLKSLLQYHSLKASILWLSTFFMVQLSHLYMSTGKTIALTIWTFVSKVMFLLQNCIGLSELITQ